MSHLSAPLLKARPSSILRKTTSLGSSYSPTSRNLLLRQYVFRNSISRSYTAAAESQATSTVAAAPTRASLPIRFLRTIGLALVFIPVGFAMATVPVIPAINGLLNPPTDAETLTMFEPYDERCAEIDSHIMNHAIAQELRKNPDMVESRPFLKLPVEAQAHHLTSGVLGGAGRLWVPPLHFIHNKGEETVILIYLGKDICGYPGIVHGGMLATLLDEGLARCCFPALPSRVGMTANLQISYLSPLKADQFVILRAKTTKVEGRKAWVEGRIEQLDPEEGKEPVVFASATALFIEPRNAATMAKLYPVASA